MKATSYDQFAGLCAVGAGVIGLLYSLAFVVLKNQTFYSLCLLLGGLLTSAALVALYERLRGTDAAFALWGVALALVAALGSVVHAGYDLANAINPPTSDPVAAANLPSQVDPRGLLTFGVAGVGLLVLVWLMGHSRMFPAGLVYLGYLLGVLLVIIYLGRLIILDANNALVLAPAALTGFLLNPAWYIWLGLTLMGARQPGATVAGMGR